ncbi:hypothetical protein KVT40_003319 [Elsinoe batatas]|uniref:Wax synthase domain-containing protein n=1 Tax=Elsinoe batatas TaxID=2601811 RepID=A0A8K0L6M1_9PEZI|nr:hypothetical protein KVT40_003319 [Elsinoe batatas]
MIDTVVPFYLANGLLAFGLAYTAPSSGLRMLITLLITCCCLVSVRSSVAGLIPFSVGRRYIIALLLHSYNFLIFNKIRPDPKMTVSEKNWWAIGQTVDPRWGTNHGLRFRPRDPNYAPTRFELFFLRLWDLLWCSAIAWALAKYKPQTPVRHFVYTPDDFLNRIGDVSQYEMTIRTYTALSGILHEYVTIRACHSFGTCVAMLGGGDPRAWPPLFGSPLEAYTVRRYYTKFWHQLTRKALTAPAVALCRLIGLPRRSPITRFMISVLAFYVTCIMHILAMPRLERCGSYPQFRYYTAIIAAMILEDVVIKAYEIWKGHSQHVPQSATVVEKSAADAYAAGEKAGPQPSLPLRLLGYTWVLCFNIWASSITVYGIYGRCVRR